FRSPATPEGFMRRPAPRPSRPNNLAPLRASTKFRPRLEALEPRDTPTYVYWLPDGGGLWTNPANWSTGAVPGADDDVDAFPSSGSGTIVSPQGYSAAAHYLGSGADLYVDGSLTVGRATVYGALDVAGTVTVAGTPALPTPDGPGGEAAADAFLTGGYAG